LWLLPQKESLSHNLVELAPHVDKETPSVEEATIANPKTIVEQAKDDKVAVVNQKEIREREALERRENEERQRQEKEKKEKLRRMEKEKIEKGKREREEVEKKLRDKKREEQRVLAELKERQRVQAEFKDQQRMEAELKDQQRVEAEGREQKILERELQQEDKQWEDKQWEDKQWTAMKAEIENERVSVVEIEPEMSIIPNLFSSTATLREKFETLLPPSTLTMKDIDVKDHINRKKEQLPQQVKSSTLKHKVEVIVPSFD
jgi:hypothetical protein